MSHLSRGSLPDAADGHPVTSLTLVVLLLVPCVMVLLLLHCLFLGYQLVLLSRKNRHRHRGDPEAVLLRSVLQRVRRGSDVAFPPPRDERATYASLSEPVPAHPVTSSRASSREGAGLDHRFRLLRPDGATRSGSLRAPSTIRAISTAADSDSPAHSGPRVNPVPPNSPASGHTNPPNSCSQRGGGHICRGSTFEATDEISPGVPVRVFDTVAMETEYTTPPSGGSQLNTSAVGPGLDSDFGASADSDGLSSGVLASALEWDYYDPCYVRQNNVPKHQHRPAVNTKQYWV
ncbi:protein huluwa isoform X2 [Antennarius striatus]|uniref:protein huluwa isoform X2 n=1 Tax=Antennarius striatus TaxID=241820 RepID=UPI0035AE195A